MSMSERECLMKKVNEASFALDEAVLFLDTHPCDEEALCCYKKAAKMRKEAMKAYEEKCGPLQNDQVEVYENWCWIENPWPWERGGNC